MFQFSEYLKEWVYNSSYFLFFKKEVDEDSAFVYNNLNGVFLILYKKKRKFS